MDYDRLKVEVLPRWEEILRQIASPAKQKVNNRESYICPICGHGGNGDGLTLNPRSGKYSLKCFGCDFSGDIIELVGRAEGLDSFTDQLKRACFYLGIDTEERKLSGRSAQKQTKNERNTSISMDIHTNTYTQTPTQEEDYSQYYREAHSRIDKALGYLSSRGISKDTADKLGLGYEPAFKTRSVEKDSYTSWESLIIPVNRYSYVVRNISPEASPSDRYRNRGASTLYRARRALTEAQSPIYVVEGELDSISILEAGGEALGLGSTSNYTQLVQILEEARPTQPLVLALDNDEAGRTASEKLAKELDRLQVKYYIYNPFGDHKDANEALIADREALTRAVTQTADQLDKLAEAEEEKKLETEREEYFQSSAYKHIKEFIDGVNASVNTPAIATGYDLLDLTLDGGLYEGLYIVGGITSLGKTTLVLQLADQIAKSGKDVVIFSLEMARAELMSKSLSRLTLLEVMSQKLDSRLAKTARGITTGSRYKDYSKEEVDLINKAIEKYGVYAKHLFIHEGIGDLGVEEIRATIAKHKRLYGESPVVIVDYLQILAPYDMRASDKQNTDKAVLELKRISRDFKTPVIGISSLNRAGYNDEIKLEAFKESGAIEYGSDVLIGLQFAGAGEKNFNHLEAKAKDPREVELVILKNRNGRTGDKVVYKYYPMFNYFGEDIEDNVIQPKSSRRKY